MGLLMRGEEGKGEGEGVLGVVGIDVVLILVFRFLV